MGKKLLYFLIMAAFSMVSVGSVLAAKPSSGLTCATIQEGTLTDTKGNAISIGYDQWGYNYQAHMFNGWYENYSRPVVSVEGGDNLMMKWNDAWLSNKDCDGDTKLDRHYGLPNYIGSGAWLTNHAKGTYVGSSQETCRWSDFVKIVAAPADAEKINGVWYTADEVEIGPVIWGEFAIIQEITDDPCGEFNLEDYHGQLRSGLGNW